MKKVSLILSAVVMTAMMLISFQSITQEVTIGKQVWMTKNLNVDKFRNGDPIPEAKTAEEWVKAGANEEPAWCYYDNDPANGEKYGKLYNWYAVNDPRGLAPEGWHVPTDDEWTTLTDDFGEGLLPGTKMKSKSGWKNFQNYSGGGTNESGFSGLPGSNRNNNGAFNPIGIFGYWWSTSEPNNFMAWYRKLEYRQGYVDRGSSHKDMGYSVRCLRDELFEKKQTSESTIEKLEYQKVTIGTQVWMTKNLNVDKFRNGDPIPHVKTGEEWEKAGLNRQPAYCYYDNDPANDAKYGKLYNWYAVNDPRGLAPEGWKIPSDEDWSRLTDFLGGEDVAGTKMKSKSGWAEDGNGTNESGFAGLPAGLRFVDMKFIGIGSSVGWWCSTDYVAGIAALKRELYSEYGSFFGGVSDYSTGNSVRCLRD